MKKLDFRELEPMDQGGPDAPWRVDMAYARDDNLLFGERIYRKDARLWLHRDLAAVVKTAAQICRDEHGYTLIIHDGLRTFEAQARMLETRKVKENPHWVYGEPRLLSPPGKGGHPRGMAVDISLEDTFGRAVDMGTPFDFLSPDPSPQKNPAHRAYAALSDEARKNRSVLTDAMIRASKNHGMELVPLPQEWWDFRLPPGVYESYEPMRDADLPPEMQLLDQSL